MLPSPPPSAPPAPPAPFPPAPPHRPPAPPRRRRSPARWLVPLAAVAAWAAIPTAAQALEQGFIDVTVEGQGRVTGTQIDCPEDSCRGRYSWPNDTLPPRQRLTAAPAPGWRLAGWSGCFDVPGRPLECDAVPNEEGTAVLARFADATPPTLTMTAPADRVPVTPSAVLSPFVHATDNDVLDRVEYRINGVLRATATSAPWTTPVPLEGPWPDGPVTLTAEAVDRTGNRSPTVSRTLVVDGTAPQVTIDGPAIVRTRAEAHTLTFSASDAHLKAVACTVTAPDGTITGPTPCASGTPWTIAPLHIGTWTFSVTAVDAVVLSTVARVTVIREPTPDPDPGPDPDPDPGPGPGPDPDPGPGPGPDPDPGPDPGPTPGPSPHSGSGPSTGHQPASGPLSGSVPLSTPPGGSGTNDRWPASTRTRCVVPKVSRGTALKTAKKRLTRANCRVRTVRAPSRTVRAGRVIRISKSAGKNLPKGARITVTVARR